MLLLNRCLKWVFLTGLNICFSLWLAVVYYQSIREIIPNWLSLCVYLVFTLQVSYSAVMYVVIQLFPQQTLYELYNILVLTTGQYVIALGITIWLGTQHEFFRLGQALFMVSVVSPVCHIVSLLKNKEETKRTIFTIVEHSCDCVSDGESRCGRCPCPICYTNLSSGIVVKTGCEHYFHLECLSDWMKHAMYPSCPTCRTHISW